MAAKPSPPSLKASGVGRRTDARSCAVALVATTKTGGWQLWSVVRDGKRIPLAELRDHLTDRPAAAKDAHTA
jgi:hypothetical protein